MTNFLTVLGRWAVCTVQAVQTSNWGARTPAFLQAEPYGQDSVVAGGILMGEF